MAANYVDYAEQYYSKDGEPTQYAHEVGRVARLAAEHYGSTPVVEFGPLKLKRLVSKMIDAGLSRTTVNTRLGALKRMFKWGVAEELVPAHIWQAWPPDQPPQLLAPKPLGTMRMPVRAFRTSWARLPAWPPSGLRDHAPDIHDRINAFSFGDDVPALQSPGVRAVVEGAAGGRPLGTTHRVPAVTMSAKPALVMQDDDLLAFVPCNHEQPLIRSAFFDQRMIDYRLAGPS